MVGLYVESEVIHRDKTGQNKILKETNKSG